MLVLSIKLLKSAILVYVTIPLRSTISQFSGLILCNASRTQRIDSLIIVCIDLQN